MAEICVLNSVHRYKLLDIRSISCICYVCDTTKVTAIQKLEQVIIFDEINIGKAHS